MVLDAKHTTQLPQIYSSHYLCKCATSQSSDKAHPSSPAVTRGTPWHERATCWNRGTSKRETQVCTVAHNSKRKRLDPQPWRGFSQQVERVLNPPLPHRAAAAAAAAATTASAAATATPRTLAAPRQPARRGSMPPVPPRAAHAGAGDLAFAGSMHMILRACQKKRSPCPHQPSPGSRSGPGTRKLPARAEHQKRCQHAAQAKRG